MSPSTATAECRFCHQWDTAANGIGKLESETSPFGVAARCLYAPNGQLATTTDRKSVV